MSASQPSQPSQPARILIVDDHGMMREAIERRLTSAGFTVVGSASSAAQAAQMYADLRPDLLIADHTLGDGTGLTLLRKLKVDYPGVRMLMLSAAEDKSLITNYLREGAIGFLHKSIGVGEFVTCVTSALAGNRALDAYATARVLEALHDPASTGSNSPLSNREIQVLTLVSNGSTNDEIAAKLFISPQTVKTHLARIYGKLGVRDRAAAASQAIREGVVV